MARTQKNPAGAATPNRALEIVFADADQDNRFTPAISSPPSWPARMLARRFGLSLPAASAVAALAGLGGAP